MRVIALRNQDWQLTERSLPHIQTPTLITWGKYDKYLESSLAYRFGRAMPNAEAVILDRCGHFSNEEKPDKVNELMLEFL